MYKYFFIFIFYSCYAKINLLDNNFVKISGTIKYAPIDGFDSINFLNNLYEFDSFFVDTFYISKQEVSNKEYRLFVNYVKDSIAHSTLGHYKQNKTIDWSRKIDWNNVALNFLFYSEKANIKGIRELNPAKIKFESNNGGIIDIYPNELTWSVDFPDSNYKYLSDFYFKDSKFDDFPVVGVSQIQAMAYCDWFTKKINEEYYLGQSKLSVDLPTEEEWLVAASFENNIADKIKENKFNYGVVSVLNGLALKNYDVREMIFTTPCKSYEPNEKRIYNLIGNVAEWTKSTGNLIRQTDYAEHLNKNIWVQDLDSMKYRYLLLNDKVKYRLNNEQENIDNNKYILEYEICCDTVMEYDMYSNSPKMLILLKVGTLDLIPIADIISKYVNKYPNSIFIGKSIEEINTYLSSKNIVKGGSWFTNSFYLQPSTKQYFNKNEAHSYIGFRVVIKNL